VPKDEEIRNKIRKEKGERRKEKEDRYGSFCQRQKLSSHQASTPLPQPQKCGCREDKPLLLP